MGEMEIIRLMKIKNEDDIRFLFELLKERPKESYISFKMPTYKQHKDFVKSKPYLVWFIIYYDDMHVGTIYKTRQDEIGIQIKKEFQNKGISHKVIPMMYPLGKGHNFANINPLNKSSIKLFSDLGFKLIQYTYELKER
jgi:RimJ/RimL family protein N-acetyltransferase